MSEEQQELGEWTIDMLRDLCPRQKTRLGRHIVGAAILCVALSELGYHDISEVFSEVVLEDSKD